MPIKFLANHNCLIVGPSQCGKTTFILKVIEKKLVHPFPEQIYYMYNVHQEFMNHHPEITFIKGIDFSKIDTTKSSLLVLDDLLQEINDEVGRSFILGSHHHRISLFFLTQSLFNNCKIYRLMSLNTHAFVLFRNQRNTRQVATLARQCFTNSDVNRVLVAYKYECEKPRGFIILNFSPLIPKELIVIGDYWNKICPSVYL